MYGRIVGCLAYLVVTAGDFYETSAKPMPGTNTAGPIGKKWNSTGWLRLSPIEFCERVDVWRCQVDGCPECTISCPTMNSSFVGVYCVGPITPLSDWPVTVAGYHTDRNAHHAYSKRM